MLLVAVLAAAFAAAAQPVCRGPAELEKAIAAKPTAPAYNALGGWFAQRRQFACAMRAFESALRLDPGSIDTRYNLGIALLESGSVAKAVTELEVVASKRPSLIAARTALGIALTETGKYAAAEPHLRAALAAEPGNAHALEYLGRSLLNQGRAAAAIALLRKAPPSEDVLTALAAAHSRNGEPAEAIAILKRLTAEHPKSAQAQFNLGSAFAAEKRFGEAAEAYRQSLRLDPSRDVTRVSLVKALVILGGYAEALPLIQAYALRHPRDPDSPYLLGAVHRGLGNFAEAEAKLRQAASARPDHYDTRYNLGVVLLRLGKAADAETHLRKSLELDPASKEARFQLGNALRQLGRTAEARQELEAFEQRQQKGVQENIAGVTASRGNELLQSGDARGAAESYRESLRLDPNNARTHYNLALALSRLGDKAAERQALERAVELDPQLAAAQNQLGLWLLNAGDAAGAEKRLQAALAADPQHAEAASNLGVLYGQRGDNQRAEQYLKQAVENDAGFIQARVNLALVMAAQGRFADAEAHLVHVANSDPRHAQALTALGMVRTRLGRPAEGVESFRRVVAITPDSPEAHLNLGIAYGDQFAFERALEAFSEAVRLAPHLPAARYNKGRALYDLRRYEDAITEFSRVESPEAIYLAAMAEKQLDRIERAAPLFEKLVKLAPANADAWFQLGQAWQRTGRSGDAIAAWKKAAEIDPAHTQSLYALVRALPAEAAAPYQSLFANVQKTRQLTDRAQTLGNLALSLADQRDYTQSIAQMQEAISVCGECPSRPDLHKNLGLIYCRSGDLAGGRRELLLARELKPADPAIGKALAILDSLGK